MNDATAPAKPPRSNFVTVVAWVFICLGGSFGLIAVLEALATLVVPMKQIQDAMNNGQAGASLPAYSRFIINHFVLYTAVYFLAMLTVFVTAIGLLKRKRWARPTMIALLVIGVIRNVVGVALELAYFSPASMAAPPDATPEAAAAFHGMMSVMIYASAAFAIAIAAVFAWVVARLMSAQVKAEFEPPRARAEQAAEPAAS